jgi:hypothetical protein
LSETGIRPGGGSVSSFTVATRRAAGARLPGH